MRRIGCLIMHAVTTNQYHTTNKYPCYLVLFKRFVAKRPTIVACGIMSTMTSFIPIYKDLQRFKGARLFFVMSLAALGWLTPSIYAQAQEPAKEPEKEDLGDVIELNQLVVTAVSAPGTTKMDSSVAVSSYKQDALQISVPRSTGELFRNIPAVRVESSSGDGNLNLTARGLPIASGGAKYVQLQDDGLPVLLFGVLDFGTADQWERSDYGTGNLEAVVAGAASVATSNGPGAIINFISNTGSSAPSGAMGVT